MAAATDRGPRRTAVAAAVTGIAAIATVAAAAGPVAMAFDWRLGARLAPFDWQVQGRAATLALATKDGAAAITNAYRSLIANPIDAKTLTIVGAVRPGTAGTRLLNQSAALGWRDPLTNFRLVDQALRERDPVIAAQRVDAIGRTLGAARVGRFADAVLMLPGGVEAMAERGAHHLGPGWMPDWLATPARSPAIVAARGALVRRIENADGPWKRLMVRSAGAGFAADGNSSDYYSLWRETLANPALFRGAIYDGAFSQPIASDAMLGEWQTVADPPVQVDQLEPGGLQLTATTGAVGDVLFQMGFARPRLSLEARWSGSVDFAAATAWRYMCEDTAQAAESTQSVVRDGNQWVQRATFTLPTKCRLGSLWLKIARPLTPGVSSVLLRVSAN